MEINWYPGHMAKTRRLLLDQISRVDLVIELCDARLPRSSRNPDLNRMIGEKTRILILNKADLADPDVNARWVRHFRNEGLEVCTAEARAMKAADALNAIERSTREAVRRAENRGIRKIIRAMVVGVPNVGKSTYINRLRGSSVARTGDRPGITRSSQWIRITPYLEVLDTPGLLWPRLDDQTAARRLAYLGTIRDDVMNLDDLSLSLLNDLAETVPERVSDRFHVEDTGLRGLELMNAVCLGRGFLLKGKEYDYDRCCRVVLDEFRAGKLGRLSLEAPKEKGRNTHGEDGQDGANSHTEGI